MPTARRGQLALLANIPALFISTSLVVYCGLVMYAYFEQCDPYTAGAIGKVDEVR
jgi:hypothetical protein